MYWTIITVTDKDKVPDNSEVQENTEGLVYQTIIQALNISENC